MQQGARSARVCHSRPGPIRVRVEGHNGRIVGGQVSEVTRSQDGKGGRYGHGGSPTQAICGGPPSTYGDEGEAWNLDDDEDPGREGSFIDI